LRGFVELAQDWSLGERQAFLRWLLPRWRRASNPDWVVPFPLMDPFVKVELARWRRDAPEYQFPAGWLGVLGRDWDLLAVAAELEPRESWPRQELVGLMVGQLEYELHHIGEGLLLCSLEAARALASQIDSQMSELSPDERGRLDEDLRLCVQTLDDFESWSAEPEASRGSFPEWCENVGRSREFVSAVYYSQ
jgi:hypothetical protein